MNENITSRIIQYLQVKSNYALIISGEYGIGKTHFLKTVVFPEVEKLPIIPNRNPGKNSDSKAEYYKTIHLSLFGVKSIEDIQKSLFLELYPMLKSKAAKISKGILKGIGKFFSVDIDEIMQDSSLGIKETGFENLLICIDDIDRKNTSLDLTEVYGYINDLVENHGAKIIMIANEDKLRKEQDTKNEDSYSVIREKVIGVTIPFQPNIDKAFDQIIDENYKINEPVYYNFLIKHKPEIVRAIIQADNNLRNLLFFLEHFKIVFMITTEYFDLSSDLDKYSEKCKTQLLKFTLPISIEYKIGMLTEENIKSMKDLYSNTLGFNWGLLTHQNEVRIKTYGELFLEKYFPDTQMERNFFSSVFNYIIGNDGFTIEAIGRDISEYLRVTNNTVPEHQELINDLGYWNCITYSEEDYRKKTTQLLDFMKDGNIQLDQYVSVFHYASRFENVLGFDLDKLKNDHINSMNSHKDKFKPMPGISLNRRVRSDDEFKEYLLSINDETIRINNELLARAKEEHWKNKFEEFKNNHSAFIEQSSELNSDTSMVPYLSFFPIQDTSEFVIKLPNEQLINFAYYVHNRYKDYNVEYLIEEKEFLEILGDKIINIVNDNELDKIRKECFKFLANDIQRSNKLLDEYLNNSSLLNRSEIAYEDKKEEGLDGNLEEAD